MEQGVVRTELFDSFYMELKSFMGSVAKLLFFSAAEDVAVLHRRRRLIEPHYRVSQRSWACRLDVVGEPIRKILLLIFHPSLLGV